MKLAAGTFSEADKPGLPANVGDLAVKGVAGRGGSGPGGRHGGMGPFGGYPEAVDPDPYTDKSKYIAWFLLIAVGMTFAGLLGAYLMISTNRAAEWQPFDLPIQIWISTLIILASSVAYGLAERSLNKDRSGSARRWLVVTTIAGAFFVSSQIVVWIELVNRGYYVRGNPYAGFFYILTAAHLVHVTGGIIALGTVVLRSWYPPKSELERFHRLALARSVGWYWHFMGFLWIVLFLMLGFWK